MVHVGKYTIPYHGSYGNAPQFHPEHWFPDTKGFQTIKEGYFLMSGQRDWDILEREDLFKFYEMPLVNPSFTV